MKDSQYITSDESSVHTYRDATHCWALKSCKDAEPHNSMPQVMNPLIAYETLEWQDIPQGG